MARWKSVPIARRIPKRRAPPTRGKARTVPALSPTGPRWKNRCWRCGKAARSPSTAARCIDCSAAGGQFVYGLNDQGHGRPCLVGFLIKLCLDHPFAIKDEDDRPGHAKRDAARLILWVTQSKTVNQ